MINEIILKEWTHHCGDGCCFDYGTELIVNGESIAQYFNGNDPECLKELFEALQIEVNIKEE